jgi:hypothetical protein
VRLDQPLFLMFGGEPEFEQQVGLRAAARRDSELDVRVRPHELGDRPP